MQQSEINTNSNQNPVFPGSQQLHDFGLSLEKHDYKEHHNQQYTSEVKYSH